VPVTERGDAMGVLEMTVPWRPSEHDVADVQECARALAYVVVGCRRHTDLFEWAQRSLPFSLAAEIQRRLLPAAFTCEAGQLTVSGWLEPANAVGGDTFELLARPRHPARLHHRRRRPRRARRHARHAPGRQPAQRPPPRTGADGAGRGGQRRAGGALRARRLRHRAARAGRPAQRPHVDRERGPPVPYRVHDGVVDRVELAIDMPFGLRPGREFTYQEVLLRPGDRIALVTDGILERNAASLEIAALLAATADKQPQRGRLPRSGRGAPRDRWRPA
jgi:hypothetical protein